MKQKTACRRVLQEKTYMPNAVNFTQSRNQQLVSLHRKISVVCRNTVSMSTCCNALKILIKANYECSCARTLSLLKYASHNKRTWLVSSWSIYPSPHHQHVTDKSTGRNIIAYLLLSPQLPSWTESPIALSEVHGTERDGTLNATERRLVRGSGDLSPAATVINRSLRLATASWVLKNSLSATSTDATILSILTTSAPMPSARRTLHHRTSSGRESVIWHRCLDMIRCRIFFPTRHRPQWWAPGLAPSLSFSSTGKTIHCGQSYRPNQGALEKT